MSERTVEISQKIADKKGWKLNPNMEEVKVIIDGLNNNKKTKGSFYCPCKVTTGDKQRDAEIICPCKNSQNELNADGFCHCRLFTILD